MSQDLENDSPLERHKDLSPFVFLSSAPVVSDLQTAAFFTCQKVATIIQSPLRWRHSMCATIRARICYSTLAYWLIYCIKGGCAAHTMASSDYTVLVTGASG